MVFIIVDYQDG